MGSVTDVVKRHVPSSYRALCGVSNVYYSLDDLQALANFVQFKIFSTVPGATNEATTWNALETELLGMLTTLQFIPAAIDFWGDQLASVSTDPTQESVSYFDRRGDLWKAYDRIAAQAAELSNQLGVNVEVVKAVIPQVSYGDNGRNILITPDPQDFSPSYIVNPGEVMPYWNYPE